MIFEPARPKRSVGFASQSWLMTFADLAALLVTFFVMLFSMSTVEMDKWDDIEEALSRYLNPALLAENSGPGVLIELPVIAAQEGTNLDYLAGIVAVQMKEDAILGAALVQRTEDRFVMSLPGSLLFQSGAIAVSAGGNAALHRLGGILRNINNHIDVVGHSDPTRKVEDGKDVNWELSVTRAYVVSRELHRAGHQQEIVAYGFGSTRFDDLPTDVSAERRMELARRVDIIIRSTVSGRQ